MFFFLGSLYFVFFIVWLHGKSHQGPCCLPLISCCLLSCFLLIFLFFLFFWSPLSFLSCYHFLFCLLALGPLIFLPLKFDLELEDKHLNPGIATSLSVNWCCGTYLLQASLSSWHRTSILLVSNKEMHISLFSLQVPTVNSLTGQTAPYTSVPHAVWMVPHTVVAVL